MKLFVYGTLRKGLGNSGYLAGSRFLGAGTTIDKHLMTARGIPFVTHNRDVYDEEKEHLSTIRGEVYEVPADRIPMIDRLEGHPDWYRREPEKVMLDNGTVIEANLYFNRSRASHIVEDGDYAKWIDRAFR